MIAPPAFKLSKPSAQVMCGDNAKIPLPDGSVDLVFTSPPYEDARLYGELEFKVKGQDWVDWAVPRFIECLRVSRGLVAWVVEGKTRQFRWSATPALLMADLHRAGVKLRKPPIFKRDGIPGSGGPDWVKNRYEFIVCASHGKLPWSANTAMGHACTHPIGGAMSYRHKDGLRRNAQVGSRLNNKASKEKIAVMIAEGQCDPKVLHYMEVGLPPGATFHTKPTAGGERVQCYIPPERANPGNIIDCGAVGGGHLGHQLSHENEAPFPEKLADFFIRSFCPPNGTVLDTHCGSGTTLAAAYKAGRNSIGMDVRESQCDLTRRRLFAECGVSID